MYGFVLSTSTPIDGNIIAPVNTSGLGENMWDTARRWERPYSRFRVVLDMQTDEEAEYIRYVAKYLQSDKPLWFDGGKWGDIQNPVLVGYGNGADTQFYLPDQNVYESSLIVYVGADIQPLWSFEEQAGLLIFSTPPGNQIPIRAKYRRRFKCKIAGSEGSIISQTDAFKVWFTNGLELVEVP